MWRPCLQNQPGAHAGIFRHCVWKLVRKACFLIICHQLYLHQTCCFRVKSSPCNAVQTLQLPHSGKCRIVASAGFLHDREAAWRNSWLCFCFSGPCARPQTSPYDSYPAFNFPVFFYLLPCLTQQFDDVHLQTCNFLYIIYIYFN